MSTENGAQEDEKAKKEEEYLRHIESEMQIIERTGRKVKRVIEKVTTGGALTVERKLIYT